MDVPDDDIALTFLIDLGYKEVKVFEESEPELAKKRTSSKRRVKKKVTIYTEDNIISNDPDTALELGKSISQTKAEESEAAKKLKGISSLTPEEQEAVDIMQALKESKKSNRRQPGTRGSDKGTNSIPGVLDESTVISATSSEGTGIKLGVLDEEKDITKEKVILEWGDKQDSKHSDNDNDDDDVDVEKDDKDGDADDEGNDHVSDTQDADDEDVETESEKDEIYKYKIRVRKDVDEEMENTEVEESDKGDEEVTDAAKEDAIKTLEVNDDTKKTNIPQAQAYMYLQTQSPSVQKVPVSVIPETTNLPPIPKTHIETPVSTTDSLPQKDMSELKIVDHSTKALVALKSQVPTIVDSYLDSKVRDVFQKELQKQTADLIHKYSLHHLLELTNKPTPTTKHEFKKTLIEDENAMDKGVADIVKYHKIKHDDDDDGDDDDEGPSGGPNQ
nr:hypothetical protein [Tanacetum cinerariifolium]